MRPGQNRGLFLDRQNERQTDINETDIYIYIYTDRQIDKEIDRYLSTSLYLCSSSLFIE
jgi:hypothetical protein